jgi:hypothetical protein
MMGSLDTCWGVGAPNLWVTLWAISRILLDVAHQLHMVWY